jgi:hypothetical protein
MNKERAKRTLQKPAISSLSAISAALKRDYGKICKPLKRQGTPSELRENADYAGPKKGNVEKC